MLKTLITAVCLSLLLIPSSVYGQDTASDFFKNLSKEKNLLNALYSKGRQQKNTDKPFTLSSEAGLLSTSGNTDTRIVKVAFEATHELKHWSNRYDTQFLQRTNTFRTDNGKSKDETSRIEMSAQLDYKLVKPDNRLFAYVEYDDNQFNRLRDQVTVVLGWSQLSWKDSNSDFRYSIGPGYSHVRQERSGLKIEEMIVRGTMQYNLQFAKETRFRQTFSAEMGEEINKARSQSSITAKIFEKLAMKLSIDLVFNDGVSAQDSTLSTQTSISMVYNFF